MYLEVKLEAMLWPAVTITSRTRPVIANSARSSLMSGVSLLGVVNPLDARLAQRVHSSTNSNAQLQDELL